MKTIELIEKINSEIKSIDAKLEGNEIHFYENKKGQPFYKFPTWGLTRGSGTADFTNLGENGWDNVYMLHIFQLLDLLDEYIETDLKDREEKKKYWVLMPAVHNKLYMFRFNDGNVSFFPYKILDDLRKSTCNQFTEEEIKKIDERYWNFAEDVK